MAPKTKAALPDWAEEAAPSAPNAAPAPTKLPAWAEEAPSGVSHASAPTSQPDAPPVEGRVEALGNGLALGWGSRMGAGIQAGLAKATGGDAGRTYDTALRENREILDREHAAEPIRSNVLEAIGTVPSMIATRGLGTAARGAGFLGRMSQALQIGGKMGALMGAGGSRNDIGSLSHATDTLESGLLGGGLSVAAAAAPVLTGAGMLVHAAGANDPQESAAGLVNGLATLVPGLAAHTDILGKPMVQAGETARGGVLQDLIKDFLPGAAKEVRTRNAEGSRNTRSYANLLKRSTSPVNGGPSETPSIPGQPDLEAQARGKLGAEAQESYRFLRSKDPLSLKLTPEAEQGVQALLPDYEAGANQSLERFAGGKEARLKALIEELRGASGTNQSVAKPTGPSASDPFFLRPDLLPTTGTLKPNPLAGFTPEALPTAESVSPQLQPQVQSKLDAMRQEQGLGSRILTGAGKGMLQGAGGNLSAGAVLLGKPELAVAGAATGGLKALAKDPVLATSLLEPAGRALRANAQLAKRIGGFLAGASGPLFTAKLQFLMQHDPEFKQAVEAQQNGP